MAYDVFISYASKDKIAADAVCARLEAAGIRGWIAPRDIVAGTSYGEAIIEAIHGVKAMVLVFSSNANASGHIPKEVERAVSKGLAIIPFRIEDVAPGKSLDYFIGSVHWLDAMTPPMEKHLDSLAATVHKLLPAKSGDQTLPPPSGSGVWQRSAAPPADVRPMNKGAAAGTVSLNSKTLWIAVAAVIAVVVLVGAIMMMRGGRNSQNGPNPPVLTNPAPAAVANPLPAAVTSPVPAASVNPASDPIVGCYQWFNNASVMIRPNHTMVGGPFTASWQVVNAGQRTYSLTWSEQVVDTVAISPNQQSLSGGDQYGVTDSATRVGGGAGLVGIWNWFGLVRGTVTVNSNDTFLAGPATGKWQGTWQPIDESRGVYRLISSEPPKDSLALSPDRSRLAGTDQFGIAISGVRTEPCPVN